MGKNEKAVTKPNGVVCSFYEMLFHDKVCKLYTIANDLVFTDNTISTLFKKWFGGNGSVCIKNINALYFRLSFKFSYN